MALTYTTTDFYRDMNNLMSSVQRPTPPNMTLIPNSSKPNTMQSLAPTTKGDMTVLGTDGAPMSVPEGTPLYTLNKISSPTVKTTTPTTPAETAVQDLSEIKNAVQRNFGYDVWAKMRGLDSKDPQNYEKYLERAGQAKVGSAILTGVGSLLDVQNARMYRKDVEKTSSQYEAQKKIIDTNIDKTESALMENLMSNMADLDTMMAAKNVDLTSQSIAGDKAKGAMDLGKDIADMKTNGALQKAALNLEYAMNVRRAKQAETASYVNAGLNIASSVISLL